MNILLTLSQGQEGSDKQMQVPAVAQKYWALGLGLCQPRPAVSSRRMDAFVVGIRYRHLFVECMVGFLWKAGSPTTSYGKPVAQQPVTYCDVEMALFGMCVPDERRIKMFGSE